MVWLGHKAMAEMQPGGMGQEDYGPGPSGWEEQAGAAGQRGGGSSKAQQQPSQQQQPQEQQQGQQQSQHVRQPRQKQAIGAVWDATVQAGTSWCGNREGGSDGRESSSGGSSLISVGSSTCSEQDDLQLVTPLGTGVTGTVFRST